MSKKAENQLFDAHWDDHAEFWTEGVRGGKDIFADLYSVPAFIDFIGDIKGKRVLDVGCGEGRNTRAFAKQGACVTGVDVSANMILFAQEEETKKPLGIDYYTMSWTDLFAFTDRSFDIVISTLALMDGPGYQDAIKEFYRVLKNNGELFFSITHPCFITPGYTKLTDEHGVCTHRCITNYFKEDGWEFTWDLSKKPDKSDAQKFTSMSYHRTLSTYINNVIAGGFVLKEVREPRPSDAACEQNPRLKVARDVAPSFL
ncbi:MAG: class I SAM-dependent methyltransferase, partial [bacterium]